MKRWTDEKTIICPRCLYEVEEKNTKHDYDSILCKFCYEEKWRNYNKWVKSIGRDDSGFEEVK